MVGVTEMRDVDERGTSGSGEHRRSCRVSGGHECGDDAETAPEGLTSAGTSNGPATTVEESGATPGSACSDRIVASAWNRGPRQSGRSVGRRRRSDGRQGRADAFELDDTSMPRSPSGPGFDSGTREVCRAGVCAAGEHVRSALITSPVARRMPVARPFDSSTRSTVAPLRIVRFGHARATGGYVRAGAHPNAVPRVSRRWADAYDRRTVVVGHVRVTDIDRGGNGRGLNLVELLGGSRRMGIRSVGIVVFTTKSASVEPIEVRQHLVELQPGLPTRPSHRSQPASPHREHRSSLNSRRTTLSRRARQLGQGCHARPGSPNRR